MASIEVAVVGSGAFAGARSNIKNYAVDEAITPLDASLSKAGAGTLSFAATANGESLALMDNEVEIRDGSRGIVTGTVRSINSADWALTVTADSILSELNADYLAQPFTGNLGGAIAYYLSLVDITGGFEVEAEIASRTVALGGFTSNILLALTELCVAQQIEMSVVYDRIVFRRPRLNTAVTKRAKTASWNIDRGSPALAVEIYYYNWTPIANKVVYPSPLENARGAFQVDAGETLEPTRIRMSASLNSVAQPVPVNNLGPNGNGLSEYVVLGQDQLPIPAAEWLAKGGKVTVEVDPEDPGYLIINVTGMISPDDPRAPYRVGAMSSGDGNYYPAFYVTGSGVSFERTLLSVPTGATNTQQEVGQTIDNVRISSLAQALTAVQKAVARYSGLNYKISGDSASLNREGSGDEFATSKLSVFDAEFAGQKLSALNAKGWKFADFDAHYAALTADQFENQLFGNAIGARVPVEGAFFRVDSTNTTQESVTYQASPDTLLGDWDTAYAGEKFAAWDEEWAGRKMRDWDLRPLRRPEIEPATDPWPNTFYPDELFPAGSTLYRNLVPNGSMETPGSVVEVRRNLYLRPRLSLADMTPFNSGPESIVTGDGPEGTNITEFWRQTSTVASEAIGADSPSTAATIPVGPTVFSVWMRSSRLQTVQPQPIHTAAVGATNLVAPPVTLPAGVWTRVPMSFTAVAAGAIGFRVRTTSPTAQVGDTLDVCAPLLESSATLGDYFDGSFVAAGDFTYGFAGTAFASVSIQRAVQVAAQAAPNGQVIPYQSSDRPFIGTNLERYFVSTDGGLGIPIGSFEPVAGTVYTMLFMARANNRAQYVTPRIGGAVATGLMLPMGEWTEVRVTLVASTNGAARTGLLIAGGGGQLMGDTLDIDAAMIVVIPPGSEAYTGPYFDGNTLDTYYDLYQWDGPVNNSTSTRETIQYQ